MNKRFYVLFLYLAAAIMLPGSLYGQNLDWDTTFTNNEFGERIQDLVITSNKDIIGVGWSSPNIGPEPSMLKFDSLGKSKWFKRLRFDSLENGNINFIKEIPGEKDFYYVGGSSYELGVWNNDFIAKIDTSGDTLWCKFYTYPTFYGTTLNAIVLNDKSLVSIGTIQTATFYDIITRRIDSLGSTMWENTFNMPGEQNGYDIAEMLDGSLILGGSNDGNNLLLRINFAGNLLDSATTNTALGDISIQDLTVLMNNSLGVGLGTRQGSNMEFGQYFQFDSALNLVKSKAMGQAIVNGPIVMQDTSFLFNRFTSSDSFQIERVSTDLNLNYWQFVYGDNSNWRRLANTIVVKGNSLYLGGVDRTTNQNYWLGKISGVSQEWIPDRCAYQPPIAGFEYEYNYPVLTLRDTSSGGLRYLDTVYTWDWTTSLGQGGNMDSTEIFLDTAVNKSIDIQLVISNWYGCTDTVNKTLIFDPNGISEFKELEVKVYPNPVKERLYIELDQYDVATHFTLFDLHGRAKLSQPLTNSNSEVNLAQLPQGLYIYEIRSGGQIKRGKLIKE